MYISNKQACISLGILLTAFLTSCIGAETNELKEEKPRLAEAPDASVTQKSPLDVMDDSKDDYTPIAAQVAAFKWAEPKHGDALIEPIPMFFGDVNGDGAEDLLAVIFANVGVSGHIVEPTIFIKEGESFTPYEVLGPISGVEPRDIKMSYARVVLTTSVHKDGDANCCPSGQKTWTLDLDFYEDSVHAKE